MAPTARTSGIHPNGGKKARGAVVLWGEGSLFQVLPPGTIVTRIDGKPAHLVLDRAAQEAWGLEPDVEVFASPEILAAGKNTEIEYARRLLVEEGRKR